MPPCFNSKGENIENVNVSDATNSNNIIATKINTKEENEMNQIENDLNIKEKFKKKYIDIILAFFVIQSVLALQMGLTI